MLVDHVGARADATPEPSAGVDCDTEFWEPRPYHNQMTDGTMSKTKKDKAKKNGKAFANLNRLAGILSGPIPQDSLIAAIEAAAAAAIDVLKSAAAVEAPADTEAKAKPKKKAGSKKKRKKEKPAAVVALDEIVDSHE